MPWLEEVYDKMLNRTGVMWDEKLDSGWVRWEDDQVEVIQTNAHFNGGARYEIREWKSKKSANSVNMRRK